MTKLDSQRHMEETMRRGYEGRYVSRSRLTRGHFLNSPLNSKIRRDASDENTNVSMKIKRRCLWNAITQAITKKIPGR